MLDPVHSREDKRSILTPAAFSSLPVRPLIPAICTPRSITPLAAATFQYFPLLFYRTSLLTFPSTCSNQLLHVTRLFHLGPFQSFSPADRSDIYNPFVSMEISPSPHLSSRPSTQRKRQGCVVILAALPPAPFWKKTKKNITSRIWMEVDEQEAIVMDSFKTAGTLKKKK